MSLPAPPRCKKIPKLISEHGETREDPYYWLREKENPEVHAYVESENQYYHCALAKMADLKDRFFEELKSMMEPEEVSVPYPLGPYFYGSRTPAGIQYPRYFRKKSLTDTVEETLLDLNILAKDHSYLSLGAFTVSDDHQMLAYSLDTTGGEEHRIFFKNLSGGSTPTPLIEKVEGDLVFSKDGKCLYYSKLSDQTRPYQVWRHTLGESAEKDQLLFEESDPRFFVSIQESSDGEWIFMRLQSMESIEYRYAKRTSDFRDFKIFSARAPKHEYELDSQTDRFLILSNRDERNFILYEAAHDAPENWNVIFRGDGRTDLRELCVLEGHLSLLYGQGGVPSIRVFKKSPIGKPDTGSWEIPFPETIREVSFHSNREYAKKLLRLRYSSPITPQQTLDFDLESRASQLLQKREVPGFDPSTLEVERIEATSHDGVKVPISLIYRKKDKGKALPTLLYGYGSYGMTTSTPFSIVRSATANQGFLYAIAHIRGSGDLGRRWYEDGKFLKKPNTFLDFQACAKALVEQGRTPAGEITLHGGSAGGLLVAATLNLDPSLYRGAIAEVPFVDVLSTMMDETLPLTPIEWDEWGDPRKPEFFKVMKAYSPYDNLKAGEYPYILVNGGWNDPRVTYWEPAKYVARLRDLRKDSRLTFLDIEMGAGHSGVTGRFSSLEKPAEILAFLYTIHFERDRLV